MHSSNVMFWLEESVTQNVTYGYYHTYISVWNSVQYSLFELIAFWISKVSFPLCSFCKTHNEQFYTFMMSNYCTTPFLMLQSTTFRFLDAANDHLMLNHLILLIFKMYVYTSRKSGYLSLADFQAPINKIKLSKGSYLKII